MTQGYTMTEKRITDRLLRRPEVQETTGLSRSGIYAAMKAHRFPRPIRIGLRAVAWRESDIQAWIDERGVLRND